MYSSARTLGSSSFDSGLSASSYKSGDYHALHQTLQKQRESVRLSRADLSSTLLRLGEYHVRNKEYDDAMNAFAEALHEKRSAYPYVVTLNQSSSTSIISGQDLSVTGSASVHSSISTMDPEKRMQELDDIMATLSKMGNVHSLRGEHTEAMRYYNEVMSIRSTRSTLSTGPDATSTSCSGSSLSGIGGMDEDNSTILTELNEDVRALDDLFRSISFRNGELDGVGMKTSAKKRKQQFTADHTSGEGARLKRKDRRQRDGLPPISPIFSGNQPRDEQRFDFDTDERSRTPSPVVDDPVMPTSEICEAIDMYRSVLDSYDGEDCETHEQDYLEYVNRMAMLQERQQDEHSQDQRSLREEELHLALEVYDRVLSAERVIESSQAGPETEPDVLVTNDTSARQASIQVASTLITMGSLHYKLNNVNEELRLYNEALTVCTKTLGDNHTFVAGTRKNIGMVLAERSKFDAAMDQFQKARAIYLRVNNGNGCCRDVASAVSCMGNVQNRRGNLSEALNLYGEALHIYRTIADEEDGSIGSVSAIKDVTSTLKVIGMVHAQMGALDDAMGCFQEAMGLLRSAGDSADNGRSIASILTRIGGIFYKKGEYSDAMSHYQEAYDLSTTTLGTTYHPDIAGILHYISGIYHKRAQYVDAMSCYKECVKIYHATLGTDNPAVATTLVCIASIHFKKKNLGKSLIFYKEALRLNRDSYGPQHPDVAPTLKSIGMIHTKREEFKEAMDAFQEVLRISCAVKGSSSPEVASAYKSIGNLQFKMGEFGDAERQYRHALSLYRQTLGEEHAATVSVLKSIDHIRENMKAVQGRLDQQESQASRCNSTPRSLHSTRSNSSRSNSNSSRSNSSRSRGVRQTDSLRRSTGSIRSLRGSGGNRSSSTPRGLSDSSIASGTITSESTSRSVRRSSSSRSSSALRGMGRF